MQLKKGDLWQVGLSFNGLRPITEQGLNEWKAHYAGNMIDDAGEVRPAPQNEWYDVVAGMKLIVVRSRVSRGIVELLNPQDGAWFLARRAEVKLYTTLHATQSADA